MKFHGVVGTYEVPAQFHAMLNAGQNGAPVTCEQIIEFYGWLRNAERRTLSKERRKERRAFERALALAEQTEKA